MKQLPNYTSANSLRFMKVYNKLVEIQKSTNKDIMIPYDNFKPLKSGTAYQRLYDGLRFLVKNYEHVASLLEGTDIPVYKLEDYLNAKAGVRISKGENGIIFKFKGSFDTNNIYDATAIDNWWNDMNEFLNDPEQHIFEIKNIIFNQDDISKVKHLMSTLEGVEYKMTEGHLWIAK